MTGKLPYLHVYSTTLNIKWGGHFWPFQKWKNIYITTITWCNAKMSWGPPASRASPNITRGGHFGGTNRGAKNLHYIRANTVGLRLPLTKLLKKQWLCCRSLWALLRASPGYLVLRRCRLLDGNVELLCRSLEQLSQLSPPSITTFIFVAFHLLGTEYVLLKCEQILHCTFSCFWARNTGNKV